MKTIGVILAGGLGSRMGGADKALLSLGGQTLLERSVSRLGPQVDAVVLNANGDPARFAAYGLPVVADDVPDRPGPLAGVLAGLDWAAQQRAEAIVTVAADTPFFPQDLATRLLSCAEGQTHPLVLAATKGEAQTRSKSRSGFVRHPTFGLWPVALRGDLRSALESGLRKVVLWSDPHGGRECVFPSDNGDPFFNINTPEDLQKAEALL